MSKASNFSQDKKLWDFHQIENRDSFLLARPRLGFLAKEVSKFLNEGKVLDVGFGDGFLFFELRRRNKKLELFGADISQENVAATKQLLDKQFISAQLVISSVEKLPFPDDFFDAVIASELIEHLDDETLNNGLKEVARVLKSTGRFFATTPANERLEDLLCYCPNCGTAFHRWGHKQSFTREKIGKLIKPFFSELKVKTIVFYGQDKPKSRVLTIIKYYIKLMVFHLSRQILGADYRLYVVAQK